MTASPTATAMPAPVLTPQPPAEGGLLLPELDPWGDSGLLYLPTATTAAQSEPQTLRSFIAEAYPRYGFHRWADVLIDLLQQFPRVVQANGDARPRASSMGSG